VLLLLSFLLKGLTNEFNFSANFSHRLNPIVDVVVGIG